MTYQGTPAPGDAGAYPPQQGYALPQSAYPPPPGYPPQPGYMPQGYPPQPGYPPYGFQPGTAPTPPMLAIGFEYGGFWIRYAARILDAVALYGLTSLLSVTIVGIVFVPFLWIGYFPYFWSKGQTPGQRVCGLRLVRESDGMPIDSGAAIVRFVVVLAELLGLIVLVGVLGLIWPAFDARKRAWHDMAAGTLLMHAQLYSR